MSKRIAVIGGGAAGLFAAIRAASQNPDDRVTIFEGSRRALAKVLVSGGGRCNVTNHTLDIKELVKKYPRGGRELLGSFSRFKVEDTMSWFKERGVELKVEADNRVFPTSDNSQTIADCLLSEAKKFKIEIIFDSKVIEVRKELTQFVVVLRNIEHNVDKVILTTGSQIGGYEIANFLGHTIIPTVPSLFTFEISSPFLKELSGVSFDSVELKMEVNGQKFSNTGPLLITHWGLSGPAVIVLSAFAARELFEVDYQADLLVNFLPSHSSEKVVALLLECKLKAPKKKFISNKFLNIPSVFWERVCKINEVPDDLIWADASKKVIQKIADSLVSMKFQIKGKGKFKEEFVTAGGIPLDEVDLRTMESKICPGLFFAGEILNIDGVTGGFNFQAAWTTGWIAGGNV